MDRREKSPRRVRLSTMQIVALGFFGVIFLGGVILWLPVCNQKPIEFIDALFTSVTSVCVTGLVTVIPAEQYTLFGQIVVLILIQIGGLGVIACLASFFLLLGKRISMKGPFFHQVRARVWRGPGNLVRHLSFNLRILQCGDRYYRKHQLYGIC